jgi:pimeloyl-ACP methyl ester carboxylesterase
MNIVDVGSGTPVVLIPGVQGRWEWMQPAVEALGRRCRVVTFSLADEPTSLGTFDVDRGFECYVEQIRDALDTSGIEKAAVCGVSYGGLVAAAFAARYPDRTESLVLVSALPPTWVPDARVRFYLRAPRLLMPLFLLASLRMYREIAAACSGSWHGLRRSLRHCWTALTHMFSPSRMARRARMLPGSGLAEQLTAVRVPMLIVTGEPHLDRVVPVALTHEYAQLCPHARLVLLPRTGHIGLITRPEEFAGIVAGFADESAGQSLARRRIG